MAFNINAQIILQAPKNIKAITSSIQSQLQGVTINIGANVPKALQQQLNVLNTTLRQLSQSNQKAGSSGKQAAGGLKVMGQAAQTAGGAMNMLGKETALTFKRFAAAGLVTATFFRMTQAISEAIPKALEFQREMVRLEQITGKTAQQLNSVSLAVRGLSTSLGVDANALAGVAKLFAQTGQSIKEVQASVQAVARSSLAPTFGEMTQTAEGLIAALNQFNIAASQSEAVLGSLNRISKKFAVESSDLIAAVRRAGGVFAIAAGDTKKPIEALQEFAAVFTAVRSTTRESAETVATGLRTIFTRLQRRGTIDALKSLGINLTDANGKFIGLFESFRILSKELDGIIQKGDAVTLSGITEELGGMRQVGKLIPAIQQFKKAEQALLEAKKGAQEGLGGDVARGLTPLIKQFELVRERFNELIRGMADSGTFKTFAQTAIGLANAFLAVGEALTPLLPVITALAGIKIGKSVGGFASGFFGSFGAGGGVKAAGQTAGGAVTGGGKAAASTVSNTQAISSLVTAIGTNTASINANNTDLINSNAALGSLKTATALLTSATNNLTTAFNSSKSTGTPAKVSGGTSAAPIVANLKAALTNNATAIASNTTALASNTTNLANISTSLASFKAVISPLKVALTSLTDASNNLKGSVSANAKRSGRIAGALSTNTTSLASNTTILRTLNTTFGSLKGAMTPIKSALANIISAANSLKQAVSSNTTSIGTIKGALANSVTALGNNTTSLGTLNTTIGGFKAAIAPVKEALASVVSAVNSLKAAVSSRSKDAGRIAGALSTNTTAIGNNTTSLGTNTTSMGANTGSLGVNTASLGNNTTSLATMTTALNSLKIVIGPANTALINLTAAVNSLRAVMLVAASKGPVIGGASGGRRGAPGMRAPRGFAAGGLVPGAGNRDTVPAMLTPGEFVIRKSAVNSVGTGALGDINGYAGGGIVVDPTQIGVVSLSPPAGGDGLQSVTGKAKITNPAAIAAMESSGTGNKKIGLNSTEANAFLNGSLNSQAKALGIDGTNLGKSALAKLVSEKTGVPRTLKADGKPGDALQKDSNAQKALSKTYDKALKSGRKGGGRSRGRGRSGGRALFSKGSLKTGGFNTSKEGATLAELSGQISSFSPGFKEQYVDGDAFEEKMHEILVKKVKGAIKDSATLLSEDFLVQPIGLQSPDVANKAISALLSKGSGAMKTISGFILEGMIGALAGAPIAGSEASFDFPVLSTQIKENLGQLFSPNNVGAFGTMRKIDAKKQHVANFGALSNKDGIAKKVVNDVNKGLFDGVTFKKGAKRYAAGGMAQGTDTVPAMLTPGEYVVNKSAAQAFGYGNLKNINRYAAGGIVKNGRGNYGVLPNPGGTSPNAALQNMNTQIGGVNNALTGLQSSLNSAGQASANSAAQSARNTAARRKATKNLGKNIKGLGGSALNAFFGFTTLTAGIDQLQDGTTSLGMAMVSIAFGISMLAPAIAPIIAVMKTAHLAWAALIVEQGGFGAALAFSTKSLMSKFGALPNIAKAGIVGAVGMIGGMLADMNADSRLGKKVSIGETGTIKGRKGVTGNQAGTAGAISGGLEGAGLGGAAGFMVGGVPGAAIGASLGLLAGAISGFTKEKDDQEDFNALKELATSMDHFAEVFAVMTQDIVLNSAQMRAATTATEQLTQRLNKQAVEITDFETGESLFGSNKGSESFREAGAGAMDFSQNQIVGNILGILGVFTPPGVAMAKATAVTETSRLTSPDTREALGLGDVAESQQFEVDRTLGERMGDAATDFWNSFGGFGLGEAQSSSERRMVAVSEGVSAVGRDSFGEVDLDVVGKQLAQATAAAGQFFKQEIEQVSTDDLVNISSDFDEAGDQLTALGVNLSNFQNQIDASVTASVLDTVTKASRSGVKQQEEMAGAYVALTAKAKGTGQTVEQLAMSMSPQAFNEFATSAGLVTGNAKAGAMAVRLLALEENKRLSTTIPTQMIMQEKLARAEAIASAALNDYVSSFTRFGDVIESESLRLGNMMGLVEGSLDGLTGANFDTAERFNPFENVDASSFDEIGNAISRIKGNTGGGGEGFKGLTEIVAIQKNLPDVLKAVTKEALSQPKAQTQDEVATSLRTGLEDSLSSATLADGTSAGLDIANVPPQIMEALNASVSSLIGNREDAAGTTEDELKRLFESEDFEKIMEEFSDATEPVLEALSGLDSAITEYEKAQIGLIQKQTEFANMEIEARLRQIDIINKTSDALDKFRPGGGPKDTVVRAEERVRKRQEGILGVGGIGGASATTNVKQQQATVARLRAQNQEIRQRMSDSGGPRIGADVDISTAGAFSATAVETAQSDLLANSQALNAHEQALQTLISSTDILDATMAELSSIEKSRLDSRQLANFEAKRFATVLKEKDPIKRAALMKDQFAGETAFNKLQEGEDLTPTDIAALIDGGLERRLAIGVASGDITEEQAEERRAQFGNFLSEVALPGMNTAAGSPFDAAAIAQLTSATALGGTAQGTTDEEKTLIAEATKLAKEKAAAVQADIELQADAFKTVVENAQKELANFSSAVAIATQKVNDAQIQMNIELEKAQKLRESAAADKVKIEGEAPKKFVEEAEAAGEAASQENNVLNRDNPNNPTQIGNAAAADLASEQFANQKINDMVAENKGDASKGLTAEQGREFQINAGTGDEMIKKTGLLMEALATIDKLMASGELEGTKTDLAGNETPLTREDFIDQMLGMGTGDTVVNADGDRVSAGGSGQFNADALGGGDPAVVKALKPLEQMSTQMLRPGSIYVHDIYVEKLLMEIVKLLGGGEEELKRASDAAKKEIAGLKSPTGGLGVAAGNLGGAGDIPPKEMDALMASDAQSLVEKLNSGTLQEGGTPAQKDEAAALAKKMKVNSPSTDSAQVAAGGSMEDAIRSIGGRAGMMGGPSLIPEFERKNIESIDLPDLPGSPVDLNNAEDRMKNIELGDRGFELDNFMPGLGGAVQQGRTNFGRSGESPTTRPTSVSEQVGDLENNRISKGFGGGMSDDDLTFDVLGLGDKGLLGSRNKGDIGPEQKALALEQANSKEKVKRQNVLFQQFMAQKKKRADDPDFVTESGSDSAEGDREIYDKASAKIDKSKFFGDKFMTPDEIEKFKEEEGARRNEHWDAKNPMKAPSLFPATGGFAQVAAAGGNQAAFESVGGTAGMKGGPSLIPDEDRQSILNIIDQPQNQGGEGGLFQPRQGNVANTPAVSADDAFSGVGMSGLSAAGGLDNINPSSYQAGGGGHANNLMDQSNNMAAKAISAGRSDGTPGSVAGTPARDPRRSGTNEFLNNAPQLAAGGGGSMGAAGGEGVDIRTLVDAINSLNQVTVNVLVAPINVILNTGGLADQLRVIIGKEALKALKGEVMNNAIDDRIREFNATEPAG